MLVRQLLHVTVYIILTVLAWTAVYCSVIKPDPPPNPVRLQCEAACDNMKALDVPGWEGTPTGISCADVCVDFLTGIPPFPFPTKCLTEAKTQGEALTCE